MVTWFSPCIAFLMQQRASHHNIMWCLSKSCATVLLVDITSWCLSKSCASVLLVHTALWCLTKSCASVLLAHTAWWCFVPCGSNHCNRGCQDQYHLQQLLQCCCIGSLFPQGRVNDGIIRVCSHVTSFLVFQQLSPYLWGSQI